MVDLTSHGVSFALLQGQLLAGEISRSGGGKRRSMVASLRYLDTFVKTDGTWLCSERLLYVDWADERALS